MKHITSKALRDALRKGERAEGIVSKDADVTETASDNVIRFVFSTPSVDRSGDSVKSRGIDTRDYMSRNPVVLLHHDMHTFPIGRCLSIEATDKELSGEIEFFTDLAYADIGENAAATMELVRRGVMGISITFLPREFELNSTDGLDFTKCELVEVSCVTVPCNRDAFKIDEQTLSPETVSNDARRAASAMRRRAILIAAYNIL